MALDSTVPRGCEGRRAAASEERLRVLLVVRDPGEADALADGLAANFPLDVLPVSTVEGARMALVAERYHVVVVEGRWWGLAWLEGLDPGPRVVVLGPLRKGALPPGGVVVEEWPGPVGRLAEVILMAAAGARP